MDLTRILVTVGLIAALLTTGGLGYDKVMSDRGLDALQSARDAMADRVAAMEREGQPGYKLRQARANLSAMDKMLRRARSDEKLLLDKKGRAATKDALLNLVKGVALNDILTLGDLALDSTFKLSDAHAGTQSEHHQRLSAQVAQVRTLLEAHGRGEARALQGDDLDFCIAAAELAHITKLIKEERGIDESDPIFVNVLERYLDDYYLREGERPLPASIRGWVDTIVAARYGDDVDAGSGSSHYVVWLHPWPSYTMLGLDRSDMWGNRHRYDGILHVGPESEVQQINSGEAPAKRYADDPVMMCLFRKQVTFAPDSHGLDADRLAEQSMPYWPVLAEDGSFPTFASKEEATRWVCGGLKLVHRVENHDAYPGCPAFTGATLPTGERVILGNVTCP